MALVRRDEPVTLEALMESLDDRTPRERFIESILKKED
jgi:hypothetical protein